MTVSGTGCLSRKHALTSIHFTVSRFRWLSLTLPTVTSLWHNQESSRREIGASFKGVYAGSAFFLEGQSVSKTNIPRHWFRNGQDTSINTPSYAFPLTEPDQTRSKHLLSPKRKDAVVFLRNIKGWWFSSLEYTIVRHSCHLWMGSHSILHSQLIQGHRWNRSFNRCTQQRTDV